MIDEGIFDENGNAIRCPNRGVFLDNWIVDHELANFFHLNIVSLTKNEDELSELLRAHDNSFGFCALSEISILESETNLFVFDS
jgi:hypothetical protein